MNYQYYPQSLYYSQNFNYSQPVSPSKKFNLNNKPYTHNINTTINLHNQPIITLSPSVFNHPQHMHADSLNLNAMCAEFTISEQAEKLKTSKSLEQDNFKMTSNVKLPKYDYNPELQKSNPFKKAEDLRNLIQTFNNNSKSGQASMNLIEQNKSMFNNNIFRQETQDKYQKQKKEILKSLLNKKITNGKEIYKKVSEQMMIDNESSKKIPPSIQFQPSTSDKFQSQTQSFPTSLNNTKRNIIKNEEKQRITIPEIQYQPIKHIDMIKKIKEQDQIIDNFIQNEKILSDKLDRINLQNQHMKEKIHDLESSERKLQQIMMKLEDQIGEYQKQFEYMNNQLRDKENQIHVCKQIIDHNEEELTEKFNQLFNNTMRIDDESGQLKIQLQEKHDQIKQKEDQIQQLNLHIGHLDTQQGQFQKTSQEFIQKIQLENQLFIQELKEMKENKQKLESQIIENKYLIEYLQNQHKEQEKNNLNQKELLENEKIQNQNYQDVIQENKKNIQEQIAIISNKDTSIQQLQSQNNYINEEMEQLRIKFNNLALQNVFQNSEQEKEKQLIRDHAEKEKLILNDKILLLEQFISNSTDVKNSNSNIASFPSLNTLNISPQQDAQIQTQIIEQMQEEMKNQQDTILQLEVQLEQSKVIIDDLNSQIKNHLWKIDEHSSSINEKENQLQEVQSQLDKKQSEIIAKEKEREFLRLQAKQINEKSEELQEKNEILQRQLKSSDLRMNELRLDVKTLQKEKQQQVISSQEEKQNFLDMIEQLVQEKLSMIHEIEQQSKNLENQMNIIEQLTEKLVIEEQKSKNAHNEILQLKESNSENSLKKQGYEGKLENSKCQEIQTEPDNEAKEEIEQLTKDNQIKNDLLGELQNTLKKENQENTHLHNQVIKINEQIKTQENDIQLLSSTIIEQQEIQTLLKQQIEEAERQQENKQQLITNLYEEKYSLALKIKNLIIENNENQIKFEKQMKEKQGLIDQKKEQMEIKNKMISQLEENVQELNIRLRKCGEEVQNSFDEQRERKQQLDYYKQMMEDLKSELNMVNSMRMENEDKIVELENNLVTKDQELQQEKQKVINLQIELRQELERQENVNVNQLKDEQNNNENLQQDYESLQQFNIQQAMTIQSLNNHINEMEKQLQAFNLEKNQKFEISIQQQLNHAQSQLNCQNLNEIIQSKQLIIDQLNQNINNQSNQIQASQQQITALETFANHFVNLLNNNQEYSIDQFYANIAEYLNNNNSLTFKLEPLPQTILLSVGSQNSLPNDIQQLNSQNSLDNNNIEELRKQLQDQKSINQQLLQDKMELNPQKLVHSVGMHQEMQSLILKNLYKQKNQIKEMQELMKQEQINSNELKETKTKYEKVIQFQQDEMEKLRKQCIQSGLITDADVDQQSEQMKEEKSDLRDSGVQQQSSQKSIGSSRTKEECKNLFKQINKMTMMTAGLMSGKMDFNTLNNLQQQ